MSDMGPHRTPAEPDRKVVEYAIAEALKIAQRQGITAANFIQMLDSGMRISDFLNTKRTGAGTPRCHRAARKVG